MAQGRKKTPGKNLFAIFEKWHIGERKLQEETCLPIFEKWHRRERNSWNKLRDGKLLVRNREKENFRKSTRSAGKDRERGRWKTSVSQPGQ
jgi:hypothetical protein